MMEKIIGREEEQITLEEFFNSKKAEFLAIYGRRRIGKTILIRSFFQRKKNLIFLNTTGTLQGIMQDQIENFTQQIGEAFCRIKLIICGSSAAWIINKIINNKGGLHNRITRIIHLEPYTLRDTKRFLSHLGVKLNNQQITQLYMAIGGVPYYLSYIKRGMSAAQNIENLAFQRKSFLLGEFNNLFAALFEDADIYINIVRTIAKNRYGIEQEELFNRIKDFSKGGRGTDKLKALEDASFIIRFKPHLHQRKGIYYRVIDEYTLFYFNWIEPIKETLLVRGMKKNYWSSMHNTPEWYSWAGYSFEALCYKHISQISEALNLSPTAIPNTWRYTPIKDKRRRSTNRFAF